MTDTDYATRVRALNDAFRQTLRGGTVLITAGVRSLGPSTKASALAAIKRFEDWEERNDPYREHDFGAFTLDGERFFFKIDTYDLARERHSPDATDPTVTARVLTVMLAEEY